MGGNAFTNVGAVHISELHKTVETVAAGANLPKPYVVLGSCGKKLWSGDIDIAVDIRPDTINDFFLHLKSIYGDHEVRKSGSCISVPAPIVNYDDSIGTTRKRTGYVQVDFMFGNPVWLSFYYHSPVVSKFKGTHRNIAISTLAGFVNRIEHTNEVNNEGMCVDVSRYKWSSSDGLSYVRRVYKWNTRTQAWAKTKTETIEQTGVITPDAVAYRLFDTANNPKLNAQYLDSAEGMFAAIEIMYRNDPVTLNKVYDALARNFATHHDIKQYEWEYPTEIQQRIDALNNGA